MNLSFLLKKPTLKDFFTFVILHFLLVVFSPILLTINCKKRAGKDNEIFVQIVYQVSIFFGAVN